MRALFPLGLLLWCGTFANADEVAEPKEIVWEGRYALGAELEDSGLPNDVPNSTTTQPRLRFGVVGSWSFSMRWERVEQSAMEPGKTPPGLSVDEAKLIELTNAERKKLNLPALRSDPVLMKLARDHSAHMARLDQIGHDLEGKTFSQRMDQAGYRAQRAGENVAQGQQSPADAVSSWMQSSGHKANILQSDYTRIGVGMKKSKSGKPYFTQVFAKPVGRPN